MSVTLPFVPLSSRELRDVLAGRGGPLSRRGAIARVAQSDLPDKEALLREVLFGARESSVDRAVAATGLAVIGTSDALEVIAQTASRRERVFLLPAIRLLGRTGGLREWQTLQAIAEAGDDQVAVEARFGAAVIAYRLGLDGPGFDPGPVEPLQTNDEISNLSFERAEAPVVAMGRKALAAERFPFEVVADAVYDVRCRRRAMLLCFNGSLLRRGGFDGLLRRKALVAVCATRLEDRNDYAMSHVAVTDPLEGSRLRVLVCSLSGKPVLTGDATAAGGLVFQLRSVRRPGAAAVDIAARFADGGLSVERATVGHRALDKVSPRRFS